jgi:uncharacterized membrane protein
MIKNTLNVIIVLIISISIYLCVSIYFSEANKKKINVNRTIIDSKIKNNISNLIILENNTDNVIEFNSGFNNTKNKIKRNFWDLLKKNE